MSALSFLAGVVTALAFCFVATMAVAVRLTIAGLGKVATPKHGLRLTGQDGKTVLEIPGGDPRFPFAEALVVAIAEARDRARRNAAVRAN